jgi:hypothetical protein
MAPATPAGAGWVHARPLRRPPAPGTSQRPPLPAHPARGASSLSKIGRRSPASSSFVLARARPARGCGRSSWTPPAPRRKPAATRKRRTAVTPRRPSQVTGSHRHALLTARTPMGAVFGGRSRIRTWEDCRRRFLQTVAGTGLTWANIRRMRHFGTHLTCSGPPAEDAGHSATRASTCLQHRRVAATPDRVFGAEWSAGFGPADPQAQQVPSTGWVLGSNRSEARPHPAAICLSTTASSGNCCWRTTWPTGPPGSGPVWPSALSRTCPAALATPPIATRVCAG